jgi:hypothetical protein
VAAQAGGLGPAGGGVIAQHQDDLVDQEADRAGAGGHDQDAALGPPVGQAQGDPQADQGDRALAAAEPAQAGGRQAGDGRLAGADIDHLADPLAGCELPRL